MSDSWYQFGEIRLCAMVNDQCGWLMWLAEDGDAGFSSRGEPDAEGEVAFLLSNGQRDVYPRSWMLPLETIERAVQHFEKTGERAPFVSWQEDASL